MKSLGQALYYIVDENDEHNRLSKAFNYFLMVLIVLSVGEMALETDRFIFIAYERYFTVFDYFTVIIFLTEYCIRIITAHLIPENAGKTRWQSICSYIFSFAGIIDLVSILPFPGLYLRNFRMLRLLRFFRVFKITRYNDSIKLVAGVIKDKRSEIGVIMGLIIIIMIIASFLMFYAEHEAQPEAFPNVLGCLWWSVVTMTTIGYGDVYPVTVLGKTIGSVMAILGIGLVAMPTGIISAGFLEKVNEKQKKEKPEKEDKKLYCPYCGHKLEED